METRAALSALTAATAAALDVASCQLWNGWSRSVYVHEIWLHWRTGGTTFTARGARTTARGTQSSTVALNALHLFDSPRTLVPTNINLDLDFSVEPTFTAGIYLFAVNMTAAASDPRHIPFDRPIEVPASEGLALVNGGGTIGQLDATFIISF